MKRIVLALALTVCGVGALHAQTISNYGQMQMNAIKGSNSAAMYSTQRMRNGIYTSSVPQFGYSNVNRNLFQGVGAQPQANRQKPFSGAQTQRGPNTSPYLGMLSNNPYTSSTTNYFTNVRPQLEQQRANDQLMAQNIKMQQQLQQLATKPPFDPTGSEDRAPTGHSAVFQEHGGMYGNPGGYYPQVPVRSVRGRR
jgi:hypothetical protein